MPTLLLLIFTFFAAATLAEERSESLHERYVVGEYDLTQAQFVVSSRDRPPLDAQWESVKLPHLWTREGVAGRMGWYRFKLPNEPYPEQYAIYLWRFSMNAAVWLNDEFLGDGGSFEEPIARNWNRPFLFLLPNSALRPQSNYLYVRLAVYPGWGHLPPVIVGPYDKLVSDYERRYQWQITFSEWTFLVSIITALVSLTFFTIDRKLSLYGIFAITCFAWSLYSLNNFLQNIPVSAKTWWWLVHSSVDWYGITLAMFSHRLIGTARPRLEKVLICFGVIASIFYAVIELPTLSKFNSIPHGVTLTIAIYLMIISIYHAIRQPAPDKIALAFCMSIIAVFGLHDLSMNSMITVSLWQEQFFWLQFSAPVLMLTMLVILSRRFVNALQTRLTMEQQMREERERIFADVHDDIGSKILSLVYAAESEHQAGIARDALRDVRAIVSGASQTGGLLSSLMEDWRAEVQERCELANIELEWMIVNDHDGLLQDGQHYHVRRILRELISNAIKHTSTPRLCVVVTSDNSNLSLSVRDFGEHPSEQDSDFQVGNGLASVNRRVKDLKGIVSWKSAKPGSLVQVEIPWQ